MMAVERAFEPVSVNPILDGTRLELRIHGEGQQGFGDRTALLTAKEARVLAYYLLIEGEKLK